MNSYSKKAREAQAIQDRAGLGGCFLTAFAIAIANPVTILSFLAAFAAMGIGEVSTPGQGVQMVSGILLGTGGWWCLLILTASWVYFSRPLYGTAGGDWRQCMKLLDRVTPLLLALLFSLTVCENTAAAAGGITETQFTDIPTAWNDASRPPAEAVTLLFAIFAWLATGKIKTIDVTLLICKIRKEWYTT